MHASTFFVTDTSSSQSWAMVSNVMVSNKVPPCFLRMQIPHSVQNSTCLEPSMLVSSCLADTVAHTLVHDHGCMHTFFARLLMSEGSYVVQCYKCYKS